VPTVTNIPVLKVGDALLVRLDGGLGDADASALQQDVAAQVVDTGAQGVLLDLSSVDVVDSFLARVLHDTAAVIGALDATTVVVGIRPAVAITMAELGLDLGGLPTALSVDAGMRELNARNEVRDRELP
jgi:rsbT antagonist protein RsbS